MWIHLKTEIQSNGQRFNNNTKSVCLSWNSTRLTKTTTYKFLLKLSQQWNRSKLATFHILASCWSQRKPCKWESVGKVNVSVPMTCATMVRDVPGWCLQRSVDIGERVDPRHQSMASGLGRESWLQVLPEQGLCYARPASCIGDDGSLQQARGVGIGSKVHDLFVARSLVIKLTSIRFLGESRWEFAIVVGRTGTVWIFDCEVT